jgi:hypothetical protein
MDLREFDVNVGWIHLAQDRDQWRGLARTVVNFQVPLNFGKFLCGCATVGFSRRTKLVLIIFGEEYKL